MQWLTTLEQSSISTWVRESGSIWAYPTVLTLHTLGLGILVGANTAFDLRLLGFARTVPLADLAVLFKWMWAGFLLNAVTGLLLFAADATTKGTQTVFYVKLVCIVLALATMTQLNFSVYGRRRDLSTESSRIRALAVASLILWTAAITAGRFMAYL